MSYVVPSRSICERRRKTQSVKKGDLMAKPKKSDKKSNGFCPTYQQPFTIGKFAGSWVAMTDEIDNYVATE